MPKRRPGPWLQRPVVSGADDRFIKELVAPERLRLTGEGGLLQQLMKRLLESSLDGGMTDHLGYDKHDTVGRNGGNSRNGKRSKTLLVDVGLVAVTVPRDREGSLERRSSSSGSAD